ncbi:MAG: alpha-N-arabinofuranosidase [candidate division NC10 bacterium]|nr:alpha-N-arabinofuranosidase [candidate division NC10 bacterium]MBI2456351.1 alpha-N-arabinofuranosidase [candidate division NC10 bacterium]MBI3120813.1 alpha-N-arabinofuranosidase [candidate division NC10 bacterium]
MAKIGIDLDRKIGTVDRRIFGNFVEHLGRCIYGGLFEEGSPLSDEKGFRRDVLEAVRRLRVPILRWPGGNFVSGYHWLDGVRPRENRPRRMELAWFAEESNRFGTDEFIQYCRAIETEPYVCVNMGSGTMDEAQAWVEYANGTGNTHWANLRRKNGYPEPHRVTYWGLGNEMYGGWQIGALEAQEYVKKARAFAMVMKRSDPRIVLVSCGQNGWNPWDEIVLEGLASVVDYHSIHLYTGHSDYHVNVFQPHQAERAVRICERVIERARYNQRVTHPIHIAFDEWNVWYRTRSHEDRVAGIEERYTLADALAVATYLNIFIRYCRIVRIANLAQLVNAIAPIFTNRQGLFLQTIYHPLRLYAEHTRGIALDVHVDCDTHELSPAQEEGGFGRRFHVADLGPFKLLDAVATCDATGRQVTLAVVNRDRDREHRATIQLVGGGARSGVDVAEVNGAGPDAMNSFEHPEAVGVREQRMNLGGSTFEYVFPAHSITLLRLDMA